MKTPTFWARTCLSHICLFVATVFCCLYTHDLRAGGYVDKDSYLYPIMIDIRYKRYDEAMAKLEPYALKGDATALFWYGYMKQENFGRDRYDAYRWYEQSIEGDNPYSMFRLSAGASSRVCEANGWECPDENLDKAVERWKALAEDGDVRAEYYHWYYDRSSIQVIYDRRLSDNYTEMVIKTANKGYYRPLVETIGIARRAKEDYREYWGEEMYQALLDNIDNDPKIAKHFVHNPYPGMTKKQRKELYFDVVKKGGGGVLFDWAIDEGIISNEEAYVFYHVRDLGKGEEFDEEYYKKTYKIPSNKVSDLNKKAEEFYNNMEHVINFDEMDFMYRFEPDV